MHVGTDFLKLPPVTGQYWSLFQCSMLGTGGTCVVSAFAEPSSWCAGAVLNVAWCAVCVSAAPNNWRIEDVLVVAGSFDCFCCPCASVHRPSIACLAVFLCGPGALFFHALSGPSTICPFPPHSWSAPDGLPLLLRKQPIWAAGDTPHLMPVEQGLPWHPVATGLAGQAIPFIAAASHAHAPPAPRAPFMSYLHGHPTPRWPHRNSVFRSGGRGAVGQSTKPPIAAIVHRSRPRPRQNSFFYTNCDPRCGVPRPTSRCLAWYLLSSHALVHARAPHNSIISDHNLRVTTRKGCGWSIGVSAAGLACQCGVPPALTGHISHCQWWGLVLACGTQTRPYPGVATRNLFNNSASLGRVVGGGAPTPPPP